MSQTTTLSALNLRSRPVTTADIQAVIPSQKTLTVLGNHGIWLNVRYNLLEGYVHGGFTGVKGDGQTTLWNTAVAVLGLNLRTTPALDAPIISVLPQNTTLDVLGQKGTWFHVRAGTATGYVYGEMTNSSLKPDLSATLGLDALMAQPTLSAAAIHAARQQIVAIPDATLRGDLFEQLQAKPVYRSQRDNQARDSATGGKIETRSGAMCNLTSLAMCLEYLGCSNPQPAQQFEDTLEEIRQQRKFKPRTDVQGWGSVARTFNVQVELIAGANAYNQAWFEQNVRPALRQGYGVMMSISGHIVRVQAVTPEGLVVDDPYGRCTLKPGGELQWIYHEVNAYGDTNQAVGNNSLWLWQHVGTHTMRWIARLGFATPEGKGDQVPDPSNPPPLPTRPIIPAEQPNFDASDDGVVMDGE